MAAAAELVALFRMEESISAKMEGVRRSLDRTGDAIEDVARRAPRLGDLGRNMDQLEHSSNNLAAAAVKIGPALATAAVAGAAAIGAMGKAAFDLGASFDDAFDTITARTGAMGQQLEVLKESFRTVVGNTPSSFEDVATAIGEVHQRTGAIGQPLEALTTQFLNLSRLTGTDLAGNIRTVTRLFGDWSIATADQAEAMDLLFRASQRGGGTVAELSERATQFGAPMRQLGFSFEETVALLTKFEREGVNVETVMGGMRQAIEDMSKAGIPAAEGFEALIEIIGSLEDESEATALAMQVFGARAGADLAAAIREGRFAIEELVEDLSTATEGINETAEETEDAAEKMQRQWNEVALAFEPVGTAVFDLAADLVDRLGPALVDTAKLVQPVVLWIGTHLPKALDDAGAKIDEFFATVARSLQPTQERAPAGLPEPDSALAAILGGRAARSGMETPEDIERAEAALRAQEAEGMAAAERALAAATERERRDDERERRLAAARAAWDARLQKLREGTPARPPAAPGAPPGGGPARVPRELEAAASAIDGFMGELARDAPRWERAFGQIGSRLVLAVGDAATSNSEAAGTQVARALQDLIREAERSGVPEFQALGDELAGSLHDALINRGNAAMQEAARANVEAYVEAIRQANALTPETFARALNLAAAAEGLGQGGKQIMDTLTTAMKDGGVQAINALGQAAIGMRRALFDDRELTPERAGQLWAEIWERINATIEIGTAEARTELEAFFRALNFALEVDKLGNVMADRINVAIDDAAETIREATSQAETRIQEAIDQLATSRELRAAMANVSQVQAAELANAEEAARIALQNLSDYGELRGRIRAREREDSEAELSRARALEDLQVSRAQQLANTRRQTQPGGTPVGGMGTAPQRRGGVDELREQWRQEDAQRERARAREDADRTRKRSQEDADVQQRGRDREADRLAQERIAAQVTQFRTAQAQNLQAFMDQQADNALALQQTRITNERDFAIQQAQQRLDDIKTKELAAFNEGMARITAQQGALATMYDPLIEDIKEAKRLQLELLTSGPAATMNGAPLPVAAGGAGGAAPGAAARAPGETTRPSVIINVAGHVVGTDDLLGLIDRGLAQRVEGLTAVGGF